MNKKQAITLLVALAHEMTDKYAESEKDAIWEYYEPEIQGKLDALRMECERKDARIDYLAGIASGMDDESDGECEITVSFIDDLSSDDPCHRWFMLSCGHSFTLDGLRAPIACPVCGKTVKR